MFTSILSGATQGICSYLVQVEVDAAQTLPGFELVGYLGSEVKEARERVRVALKNAGVRIPAVRITVNLSPADIKKEGTAYDLPIAVGILVSVGRIPKEAVREILFLGELGLSGEIKPVKGVLPILLKAAELGIQTCIVPKGNEKEAGVVRNMTVLGAASVSQVIEYLSAPEIQKKELIKPAKTDIEKLFMEGKADNLPDFSDINGQQAVRRAVEVAAAGFHHLLLIGPPGSGKTMIAKRIPSILPPLSIEESIEVSKIYSISGLLNESQALITQRPFLNPHHTISKYALAGGGRRPRPGVISLAHRGVLFLDELPEFKRETIEVMRQPLEDRQVHISRHNGTCSYPADFMLVAAMNPCPCGYYPDRNKCKCTPNEIRRYQSKISGPILDRLDIVIEAPKLEIGELTAGKGGESSEQMRVRVSEARQRQKIRYQGTPFRFNADLGPGEIHAYCPLGVAEEQFLEQMFRSMEFSARSYHRILKLARTIADLDGSEKITKIHLGEAVCYHRTDLPG